MHTHLTNLYAGRDNKIHFSFRLLSTIPRSQSSPQKGFNDGTNKKDEKVDSDFRCDFWNARASRFFSFYVFPDDVDCNRPEAKMETQ